MIIKTAIDLSFMIFFSVLLFWMGYNLFDMVYDSMAWRVHAIIDKRLITIGRRQSHSVPLAQITNVQVSQDRDGSGTIRIDVTTKVVKKTPKGPRYLIAGIHFLKNVRRVEEARRLLEASMRKAE
jgi:hypothetical protein